MTTFFNILPPHILGALVLVFAVGHQKQLRDQCLFLISWVVHTYLCYRYPIKHDETRRSIPTIQYQWPNGQGDVAKFLEGDENSDVWAQKFGRLYRIWSGMKPEIVLTHPKQLKEVFKDSDKHFKAVGNNSGYLMNQILGQCLGLVSGNDWRNLHSITKGAFTRTASMGYVSLVQRRIKSYFEELQSSKTLSKGLLDPAEDLKLLPFLVVAEVIYGKLSPELESKLRQMAPRREALFKHVISGGLARFAFSKYLPMKANRALAEFRAEWHALNRMAYNIAVSAASDALIISLYAAVDAGKITHEQMYQTLDEMLYANLDVTLGGISWSVVFLAASRKAQASICAEVAAKRQEDVSDTDEEGRDVGRSPAASRKFSAYLLSSSTFLAACIFESARLQPLAAFSVSQSAPTSRFIDGYLIPAGTAFVVDSYALNIRNPYWGTDSKTFRPERFIEPRPGMPTEIRYNYWRFGFGPRQCMGKYVADLIIRMLLVELVDRFELVMRDEDVEAVWERNRETWISHPKILVKCEKKGKRQVMD